MLQRLQIFYNCGRVLKRYFEGKGSPLHKQIYLLVLPDYRQVLLWWSVLFSVEIFDIEFLPDLYVLRSPESKNVVF